MKSVALVLGLMLAVALIFAACGGNGDDGTQSYTLTVEMGGTGSGRVSSSPSGIFCVTDCSESYDSGTQVTLTAAPYSGSSFSGWGGGLCNGTGPCTLSVDESATVTASFERLSTDISNLSAPFVNEADMLGVFDHFNSLYNAPPMYMVHDGFDFNPVGDLKPFQAVCSGRVKHIIMSDELVVLWFECNSQFTIQYNFETQAAGTGQAQLANITVAEGQTVSQGDLIGYLHAPNAKAHVHVSFMKDWTPICPEPYLEASAATAILELIHVVYPGADMCSGGDPVRTPLYTPYVNEPDMTRIDPGYSADHATSPWDVAHGGLDIYPQGDLKPFQASCAGVVNTVLLEYDDVDAAYQVRVDTQCDDYVYDPDQGGYFIPFSTRYIFETMSASLTDGEAQLANITVAEDQAVAQGDIVGYLYTPNADAHLHYELSQYANPRFAQFGVEPFPLCPEPFYAGSEKDSLLNLLHAAWPHANLCYP